MTDKRSSLDWYWLLPIAFIIHDAEEVLTMPDWVALHHDQLTAIFGRLHLPEQALDVIHITRPALLLGVGILLAIFVLVTECARRAGGQGVWQFAFAVVLGGFFLHGFTHLAQAVYFGGYAPGAITAGVMVIPASIYLYTRLDRSRLLTRRTAVVTALIGLAAFVPAIVLALTVGTVLTSR